MRHLSITLLFLATALIGACDLWPKDLASLAESIARQTSGETTAWLLGGDVVVINVAGSPHYGKESSELEALATDIAAQAMASVATPLESIAITFYENEVSTDPQKSREFIFLVTEDRPVLQANLDFDATGPLTADEVEAAIDRLGDSLGTEKMACVRSEVERRARLAGDPETLDPATFEFLTAETWNALDAFGKRLILAGAISTEALFACVSERESGEPDGS